MPPPAFLHLLLLSLLLLLLSAASISTIPIDATLPLPPPLPPAAPHPLHRHHHTPRAPLTPPPPPNDPSSSTDSRRCATPDAIAHADAQVPVLLRHALHRRDPYPFTNNPFFPTATSPPPPTPAAETQPSGYGGVPTFPANISMLVAPTPRASGSRHFPVLQALLLTLLSLCLLLLSALLSIHLVRRLRHRGRRSGVAASSAHRRAANDNHDGDEDESDLVHNCTCSH